MCKGGEKKQGCQKPEALKRKPADCPPEQVRKCHGGKAHPCAPAKKK